MSKLEPIRRGEYAKQVLGNPVFQEAFDILQKVYVDRMISTKPDELSTREHYHKSLLALADVKSALTACVETGKIEKVKAVRKENKEGKGE